jgi:hypothetical protein
VIGFCLTQHKLVKIIFKSCSYLKIDF